MGRCFCFKPSSMRVPLLRPFTVSCRYSNQVEVSYFLCGWDCHHTSPYGGQPDRATPFARLVISRVLSAVTPISAPHQDSNSRLVYLRLRPHVLSHFTALRDLLPLYLFCSPQSVAVSATKSASEGLSLLQNHFWNILRRNVLPVPQASAYVTTDSVQLKMNCRHLVQSPFDSTAWDLRVIRCFHISSAVQGRQKFQESSGMKTPKKERRVKKEKRIQPPMETPYVAPVPKRTVQFSPDKVIDIFEGMTLSELAQRTGNGVDALQDILMNIGEQISLEFQPISMDVAELIGMELGINVRRIHLEKGAKLQTRPAVVTVMGHVDHGKTSLLDSLRQTSVAAKEAGGITQHLGAFVVSMASGASLTFLDTPGHAAFSAMRARGAAVTDIVVLVVAADDGVMPQTREAMAHAQAANVPVVVAINKCDKANADPQKVRIQLCSEGLALEEMGGDVQVVEISATKNIGLGKLEEAVLLQAELMDLKARVDGDARAYVVEARLDRGRGPLATAIVRSGTLVVGLHIVVGAEWGRIRALRDMLGRPVPSAGPSMPVEIEGLRGLPLAGDEVVVVASEERARKLSSGRKIRIEEERLIRQSEEKAKASDPVDEQVEKVEMTLIVKADVQGTVQAVTDALKSLNSSQVFVNVVHTGVGAISQSDVDLAQACGACIVGFNVRNMPSSVEAAARQANINIRQHRIIYHLLEDIGNLIVSMAPGICETQVAGEAEILNIFELKGRSKAKGDAKIAGCRVVDGRITKTARIRVLRSGDVLFEGACQSLKREKQDVEAVGKGNECGLIVQDWNDLQIGDVIQCLELVSRKPKFISSESGAVRIEC